MPVNPDIRLMNERELNEGIDLFAGHDHDPPVIATPAKFWPGVPLITKLPDAQPDSRDFVQRPPSDEPLGTQDIYVPVPYVFKEDEPTPQEYDVRKVDVACIRRIYSAEVSRSQEITLIVNLSATEIRAIFDAAHSPSARLTLTIETPKS